MTTNLAAFNTGNYYAGPKWKVLLWYFCNYYIFNSAFPWPYSLKGRLLKLFGARIGKGFVIKTKVRIKYPWLLTVGDHCWIGESVWIDNLAPVTLGNHVCLSQGALLLTGNHDYKRADFPYRLGPINIDNGAWIGAMAVVCAGVTCGSHAVLTVNSVASKDLQPWLIYSGNPAMAVRKREINAHTVTLLNTAAI
ncbi:WcaF family extracellular polysaccharide biosynthesis acetyltransferase [Chitinophaga sp.]|jgi:putative colanic acid biosynthesis acetyltransferase WcaF|uniref:WcaF family extracellular polysaccharide biosynthesis acetyltransferase n=1 Tax=Chitinophaga sp. TaxID=1869181 RepID=UPI002CF1435C|nr:WcaF family extracellular polysaccharide biosynthesis acetyltransferase [Chitinophaga sp.]HWV65712.1 WcaF family extracellular polysaccharide biosynthesis acetyltransferase [Chitinophaga sp.]